MSFIGGFSDSVKVRVWNPNTLSYEIMTQSIINTDTLHVGVDFPESQVVSGDVTVSNFPASQAVTGTFWQETQPASVSCLPLPSGAATANNQEGLIERTAFNVLKRLNVDALGRLRVSAESAVIASGTVTALTTLANITNWGLTTATAKSQWESHQQYQVGFRRNLVHS